MGKKDKIIPFRLIICQIQKTNLIQTKQKVKRESYKDLSFGQGYVIEEEYSRSLSCKNQECKLYGELTDFYKTGIGMREAPIQMQHRDRHYAMICECPKCFSRFWFHLPDGMAKNSKELFDLGAFKKIKPNKAK